MYEEKMVDYSKNKKLKQVHAHCRKFDTDRDEDLRDFELLMVKELKREIEIKKQEFLKFDKPPSYQIFVAWIEPEYEIVSMYEEVKQ